MKIRVRQTTRTDDRYNGDDVQRIVRALQRHDFECSSDTARKLWEEYSEAYSASWLHLPKSDQEIVECLQPYFEEDV